MKKNYQHWRPISSLSKKLWANGNGNAFRISSPSPSDIRLLFFLFFPLFSVSFLDARERFRVSAGMAVPFPSLVPRLCGRLHQLLPSSGYQVHADFPDARNRGNTSVLPRGFHFPLGFCWPGGLCWDFWWNVRQFFISHFSTRILTDTKKNELTQ